MHDVQFALIIDSTIDNSNTVLCQYILWSLYVIFVLQLDVAFFKAVCKSRNKECVFKQFKMADKMSEPSVPSIRSLQSDSGIDSEGQPGSVGVSPPSSYLILNGYPKEIFKKPPRDSDLCGLCDSITRWPVQTDCACGLFCHGCLFRFIGDRTGSMQCPRCEEDFPVKDIQRDKIAHKRLLKLEIVCPHECETEMPLRDLDKHEEECPNVEIDCLNKKYGCLQPVQRIKLVEHVSEECRFRQVSCEHCGQQLLANEIENHQKECPFTDSVANVLSEDLGESGATGGHKAASQELIKNVATNLDAKIAEIRRKLMEVGNDVKVVQTQFQDHDGGINEHKQTLSEFEKSLKNLQKMVLTKLSKLPALETGVAESLTRTEFEEHRKEEFQEIRDEMTMQKERLSNIEEQVSSGSGTFSGEGVSSREKNQISENSTKIRQVEDQMSMHSMRLAEHELRFQFQETASYDGTLIWKIKEFNRRKRDADNGKTLSLYSQPFYTSRFGYKMCARIYLNGDGIGKGTHVSLFFVVMKGDYDALLTWPFSQKVTLMLLDQETGRRHLSDSFRPDPTSTSFQRPSTNMNIASGCPLFVSQSVLKDPAYVKEDTIFIKVVVDTTDLFGP